jgi:hypothetical protein
MLARALLSGDPSSIDVRIRGEEISASAKYLSDFLASSNRNLVDPPSDHDWRQIRSSELDLLISKIRRLDETAEARQVSVTDPERQMALQRHLRLKGDLARSWLYACAPTKRLLQELPPRENAIPPALWFAAIVPQSFKLWERYQSSEFAVLMEHSLSRHRRHERVLKWLAALRHPQV